MLAMGTINLWNAPNATAWCILKMSSRSLNISHKKYAKVQKGKSRELVCRDATYWHSDARTSHTRFMECPNAKGYIVYPGDYGVGISNSLTKNIEGFKKANHEN